MKEGDLVICCKAFYNLTPKKCYCINAIKATPLGDYLLLYVINDYGTVDIIPSYYFKSLSEHGKANFSMTLARKALIDYLFRSY